HTRFSRDWSSDVCSSDLTLLATGSEVEIAVAAADILRIEHEVKATVVSMPCWELFEEQDVLYRNAVLGNAPRIGVEAAARLGWRSEERRVGGRTEQLSWR